MFQNKTLGKKIGFGFAIISILTIIVGITGYFGLRHVLGVTELYKSTNTIQAIVSSIKEDVDRYFFYNYAEARKEQEAAREQAFVGIKEGQKFIDEFLNSPAAGESERKKIAHARKELNNYKNEFSKYIASEAKKIEMVKKANKLSSKSARHIEKADFWTEELHTSDAVLTAGIIRYFNRPLESAWQKIIPELKKTQKDIDSWFRKVENSDKLRAIGNEIKSTNKNLRLTLDQYHAEVINQEKYQILMNRHKENIVKACATLNGISTEKLQKQARVSLILIFSVVAAALIISVFYSVITTRRIVSKISKVVVGVSGGTDQIISASSQISAASQSLAEGTSEQASSLEETSSSLEEMASMTRQNASNAEESASASEEMNAQAEQMNGFVGELIALVGGSGSRVGNRDYAVNKKEAVERKADTGIHNALMAPAKKARGREATGHDKKSEIRGTGAMMPDESITRVFDLEENTAPGDDSDFKDF